VWDGMIYWPVGKNARSSARHLKLFNRYDNRTCSPSAGRLD
jgi:Mor family transcriptional regulator